MKEWFTPAELADIALPALPASKSALIRKAKREDWQSRLNAAGASLARKRKGRGGGWEYHFSLLPSPAQARLVKEAKRESGADAAAGNAGRQTADAWSHYEGLTDARKAKAAERLAVLEAVDALQRAGWSKDQAVCEVAGQKGVGKSSVYNWFKLVEGKPRPDWIAFLAPRHMGRTAEVECDPRAWEALKADYLRDCGPRFTVAYRNARKIADENGWAMPSARTLERKLDREIPVAVRVLTREGEDALNRMLPPQERDRTVFHALQAVNVDGHKWDVFVKWPDGSVSRPMMAAIQDLYSNKCLAWRVDKSENADLIRLTFADVFRQYGIPELAWLDNGRGFAAKCITGGTPNRYRFKVKADEPSGILTQLGVQVHWTRPYSGQSKPIERMFRDFCDAIAKHPAFDGAYTGNKPDAKPESYGSRAIPLADFLDVVDRGIREHNAREKRNTRVCGRVKSFDQAFEESYADALIRKASDETLRMCLLAAENVSAERRSGEVRLLGNRYWGEFLHDHRGEKLTLRFDPDNLHEGVHVHRLDGAFIGFADCLEAVGFADTEAARSRARMARQFRKATKEAAAIEKKLSVEELVRMLPDVPDAEPPETKTVRLVQGNTAVAAARDTETETDTMDEEEFSRSFSAGLQLLEGGRDD